MQVVETTIASNLAIKGIKPFRNLQQTYQHLAEVGDANIGAGRQHARRRVAENCVKLSNREFYASYNH